MAHQPFVGGGAGDRRMKLPRQFLTSHPVAITEKTRIVAAASPGEEDGDPCEDGWFLSDFYAMNYLYKGQGAHQVWLTAADPRALLENFGAYLHGNPRQERKVVLSQELLDANALTWPTVVRPSEIIQRVKDEVRHAAAAAVREGGNVLLLLFCHGLEHRFCLDTMDEENRLTVRELREAAGPDAPLALVASACYAGGWLVYPDVNATARAASQPEEVPEGDESPSWFDSDSLRRECGFLFAKAIAYSLTSMSSPLLANDDTTTPEPSDSAEARREKGEADSVFSRAIGSALTPPLYRTVAFQQFTFSAQDDDWEGVWAEGALTQYERRWSRLETHVEDVSQLAKNRPGRRPARPGRRKRQPVLSWSMKKRVRLLAKLYLELSPGDDVIPRTNTLNSMLRTCVKTGYPKPRRRHYYRWNLFAVVQLRVGMARLVDSLVDFFQLPRPGGGVECLMWRSFWGTEGYGEGIAVSYGTILQGPLWTRGSAYLSTALAMANRGEETTRQMVDQINALIVDVRAHGEARVLADPEVREHARAWAQSIGRHVRADLRI